MLINLLKIVNQFNYVTHLNFYTWYRKRNKVFQLCPEVFIKLREISLNENHPPVVFWLDLQYSLVLSKSIFKAQLAEEILKVLEE